MLVIVSGMYRSGSTYSFNVAREAALRRGRTSTFVNAPMQTLLDSESDQVVNKTHAEAGGLAGLIRSGQAVSVCTVRRFPEDSVQSLIHAFNFNLFEALDAMMKWFSFYEQIAGHSLIMDLTSIEAHPVHSALSIGEAIFGDYSKWEALASARRFSKRRVRALGTAIQSGAKPSVDVGFSKYDPETFFHGNHVPDRADRKAELAVADAVRTKLARWVAPNGMLRASSPAATKTPHGDCHGNQHFR